MALIKTPCQSTTQNKGVCHAEQHFLLLCAAECKTQNVSGGRSRASTCSRRSLMHLLIADLRIWITMEEHVSLDALEFEENSQRAERFVMVGYYSHDQILAATLSQLKHQSCSPRTCDFCGTVISAILSYIELLSKDHMAEKN